MAIETKLCKKLQAINCHKRKHDSIPTTQNIISYEEFIIPHNSGEKKVNNKQKEDRIRLLKGRKLRRESSKLQTNNTVLTALQVSLISKEKKKRKKKKEKATQQKV